MQLIRVYDLRGEQADPPKLPKKKHLTVNGHVVKRDVSTITGVTIHQTACRFGASKAAVAQAGGDIELATARRALGVACHGLSFAGGFYALPNPIDWYVWHANGLNDTTIGLEIEGLYAGLKDDPETRPREDLLTTWKGPPMVLSEHALETAKACLKRLVDEARGLGCPIEYIYAHRQSSETRRSDPGQEIWQALVLDYAVPVLKLRPKQGAIFGTGRPIPAQWDPFGLGNY